MVVSLARRLPSLSRAALAARSLLVIVATAVIGCRAETVVACAMRTGWAAGATKTGLAGAARLAGAAGAACAARLAGWWQGVCMAVAVERGMGSGGWPETKLALSSLVSSRNLRLLGCFYFSARVRKVETRSLARKITREKSREKITRKKNYAHSPAN